MSNKKETLAEYKARFDKGLIDTIQAPRPLYHINTDIGLDYQDTPPWRSYTLETSGNTRSSLMSNAWIEEVDQDGGTIDSYDMESFSSEVLKAVRATIEDHLKDIQ